MMTDSLAARAHAWCKENNFVPQRRRGQNFCINPRVLDNVVAALDPQPNETVVEVGPGLGFLTELLALRAAQLTAIEIEQRFADYLQQRFANQSNVHIVKDDALTFLAQPSAWPSPYAVVGLIPYNITSRFLRIVLENDAPARRVVTVMQKDVADRIVAKPGEMSLLAVACQYLADVKIIQRISAGNFWPMPKVDSALVVFEPHHVAQKERDPFFKLVSAGFAHKRKQLLPALQRQFPSARDRLALVFRELKLPAAVRPQDLSIYHWEALVRLLKVAPG